MIEQHSYVYREQSPVNTVKLNQAFLDLFDCIQEAKDIKKNIIEPYSQTDHIDSVNEVRNLEQDTIFEDYGQTDSLKHDVMDIFSSLAVDEPVDISLPFINNNERSFFNAFKNDGCAADENVRKPHGKIRNWFKHYRYHQRHHHRNRHRQFHLINSQIHFKHGKNSMHNKQYNKTKD